MDALYCYHLLPGCLAPLDERPMALLGRAAETSVQGLVTHQAYVALAQRNSPGPDSDARLRLLCSLDLNPAAALLRACDATGFRHRWNAYNRMAPLGVNSQLDNQGHLNRHSPQLVDPALHRAAQQTAQIRAEVALRCTQALVAQPSRQPPRLAALAVELGSSAWLLELIALLQEAEPRLSLGQAASRLGRSARQLQRDLAQASLRFATLSQALRLEQAANLLLNGALNLTQVAHAAGFFDSAHFNRSWWRACCLTPGQYRELMGLAMSAGHPISSPAMTSNGLHA